MNFRTIPVVTLAASLLASGAFAAPPPAHHTAIVPGADIIVTIDISALNSAPLVQRLTAETGKNKSISRSVAARWARFTAATGLAKSDIRSALISCDIDTYDFKAATAREKTARLNAVLAVQSRKPVTLAKIKKAIILEYGSEEIAGVANVTIAGHPALKIKAPKKATPDIYIAVTPDGLALLAALNSASIAQAIHRSVSGKIISEPRNLSRMRASLLPKSQIKSAAVIPASIRSLIDQQAAAMLRQSQQNPAMAAAAAITKLFHNLRNISLGLKITADATITAAADLGAQFTAQQAATVIQTMLIPIMQANITKSTPAHSPVINLDRQVKVTAKDGNLLIQLIIPQNQIIPPKKRRR